MFDEIGKFNVRILYNRFKPLDLSQLLPVLNWIPLFSVPVIKRGVTYAGTGSSTRIAQYRTVKCVCNQTGIVPFSHLFKFSVIDLSEQGILGSD
jgi:hypothetical protein